MISLTSFSTDTASLPSVFDPAAGGPPVNPATVRDAELVRRYNTGENAAFDEIVVRHRPKMFAVAFSLLRNHADAEEIAQDTFICAHRALAGFRGDSSLATWLHRIAINLARNRYRYFFRRHRHETSSLDCALNREGTATLGDLLASESPDPARMAANREFSAHVAMCMEKLSTPQRQILTLRNVLDRSYEEIAEHLGITLGTVKSRLARARENLRQLLSQLYTGPDSSGACSFLWFEPVRPSGGLE